MKRKRESQEKIWECYPGGRIVLPLRELKERPNYRPFFVGSESKAMEIALGEEHRTFGHDTYVFGCFECEKEKIYEQQR